VNLDIGAFTILSFFDVIPHDAFKKTEFSIDLSVIYIAHDVFFGDVVMAWPHVTVADQ